MILPATRPMATPPTPVDDELGIASQVEKEPVTTAAIAKLYGTRAVQSFVRFSPSMIVISRRGAPIRRMISAGGDDVRW